eukprot:434358-Rhodomonas_salina.2
MRKRAVAANPTTSCELLPGKINVISVCRHPSASASECCVEGVESVEGGGVSVSEAECQAGKSASLFCRLPLSPSPPASHSEDKLAQNLDQLPVPAHIHSTTRRLVLVRTLVLTPTSAARRSQPVLETALSLSLGASIAVSERERERERERRTDEGMQQMRGVRGGRG